MGELQTIVKDALADALSHGIKRPGEVAVHVERRLLAAPRSVLQALADSGYDPDHIVTSHRDGTFTLQHSLQCRVSGDMPRCRIHSALNALPRQPTGRYIVYLKDGELVLKKLKTTR